MNDFLTCPNCGEIPGNPEHCVHCNSSLVRFPVAGIDVNSWLVDKNDPDVIFIKKLFDFVTSQSFKGLSLRIMLGHSVMYDFSVGLGTTFTIHYHTNKFIFKKLKESKINLFFLDPDSASRIFVSACKGIYGENVFDKEDTRIVLFYLAREYYIPILQTCKCCGKTSYCINKCNACGYEFDISSTKLCNYYPSVRSLKDIFQNKENNKTTRKTNGRQTSKQSSSKNSIHNLKEESSPFNLKFIFMIILIATFFLTKCT